MGSSLSVTPNGYNTPKPTVQMLDEYRDAGHSLTKVLVDRGFSFWDATGWANELLERDIAQTIDMHSADHGSRPDPTTGVLMIDGWPYVPWTPKRLHQIPPPPRLVVREPKRGGSKKKWKTYRSNLDALEKFRRAQAELAQYALTPNGRARKDGSRQFKVPQYRRDLATARDRRMKVYNQPTLVLPASVATKLRQEHRWGSDAWIADYSRRTAIEGVFGNMKARDGEGVQRGWIRVVGLAATAIMTTFAIVHYTCAWSASGPSAPGSRATTSCSPATAPSPGTRRSPSTTTSRPPR